MDDTDKELETGVESFYDWILVATGSPYLKREVTQFVLQPPLLEIRLI